MLILFRFSKWYFLVLCSINSARIPQGYNFSTQMISSLFLWAVSVKWSVCLPYFAAFWLKFKDFYKIENSANLNLGNLSTRGQITGVSLAKWKWQAGSQVGLGPVQCVWVCEILKPVAFSYTVLSLGASLLPSSLTHIVHLGMVQCNISVRIWAVTYLVPSQEIGPCWWLPHAGCNEEWTPLVESHTYVNEWHKESQVIISFWWICAVT